MQWLLECQTRMGQRNLHDAVAIQYAIMSLGDALVVFFQRARPTLIEMDLCRI